MLRSSLSTGIGLRLQGVGVEDEHCRLLGLVVDGELTVPFAKLDDGAAVRSRPVVVLVGAVLLGGFVTGLVSPFLLFATASKDGQGRRRQQDTKHLQISHTIFLS